MIEQGAQIEAIVDAMAGLLGLEVDGENRGAVALHLRIAFGMAPDVLDFPLADDCEPAAVYAP